MVVEVGKLPSGKESKRERLRAFLEIPYVRLPLIVIILLLVGLAVEFLILTIASAYALATLVGVPTLQLVIGAISAMSALASTSVAFLLYRSSVRGADIAVELEDPLEAEMEYRIKRTLAPPSLVPAGATQELFEKLRFEFEVVLMNNGPRGGTMIDVDLELVEPLSTVRTMRDDVASEDKISMSWEMQNVTREIYRPTVFRSGRRKNSISLVSNESVVLVAGVDLFLMDRQKDVRTPLNNWLGIQQQTPYFEFKLQWKTITKRRLKPNERSFRIRPKLGEPIQEPPAVTVP